MRIEPFLLAAPLLLCGAVPASALLTCGSGAPFSSALTISATDLNFGSNTPASNAFASATISVQCGLLDLLPNFILSLTSFNGTNPAARYLDRSGAHLNYNVYTNTSYSSGAIWGDGTNGTVTQSYGALLSLGAINFTAWGKIPAGQFVAAGTYTDVITVTVSY